MNPQQSIPEPLLVIDASSAAVHVGIFNDKSWRSIQVNKGEALENLFKCTVQCLQEASIAWHEVRGVMYCRGPGNLLGLRLTAMAIAGWRALPEWQSVPLISYNSLNWQAWRLLHEPEQPRCFSVISQYRKGFFHTMSVVDGQCQSMRIVTEEELISIPRPMYHFLHRDMGNPAPKGVIDFEYSILHSPHLLITQPEIHSTTDPEIEAPSGPQYALWTGERHR